MAVSNGLNPEFEGAIGTAKTVPVPAGGVAMLSLGASGFVYAVGHGAPTLTAPKGSFYARTDGSSSSTRLYVNSTGTGGWVAVTTAS